MRVVSAQEGGLAWLPREESLAEASRALEVYLSSLGSDAMAHARVPIPAVDPLAWLHGQPGDAGRWYYQTRGGRDAVIAFAGVGSALEPFPEGDARISRLLAMSGRTTWCTGPIAFSWMPFDAGASEAGRAGGWGTLGRARQVVPLVDLRRDTEGWSLGVTVCGGSDAARAALQALAPVGALGEVPDFRVDRDGNSARWADAVEAALDAIAQGSLEKVVLARTREYVPVRGAEDAELACDVAALLREEEPASAIAMLSPGDGAAFVMASPERLYRRRDRILESHAVAGTCGRGPDGDADDRLAERLLRSDKNRREHELTLRHIEAALTSLTTEQSWQDKPRILRLAHVQHLVTEVRAALRPGVSDAAILAALHPTPAVGGVPTDRARRIIQESEEEPRGLYAGVVGISCDAASEFSVAIRSALIQGGRVRAFAGAGIVAGSDADAEWLETARKLETFDALTQRGRVAP